MEKLKRLYEDLPLKYKICVLVFVAIVMIILIRIMSYEDTSNEYTKELDYKNITSESLLENYVETYTDRDTYMILENIIEMYNSIYTGDENVYKEYYEVLDSNYVKHVSKSKFVAKMNQIFSELNNTSGTYVINMYSYLQKSGVYIVEITDGDETIGYIGIILNSSDLTYSIFYVE